MAPEPTASGRLLPATVRACPAHRTATDGPSHHAMARELATGIREDACILTGLDQRRSGHPYPNTTQIRRNRTAFAAPVIQRLGNTRPVAKPDFPVTPAPGSTPHNSRSKASLAMPGFSKDPFQTPTSQRRSLGGMPIPDPSQFRTLSVTPLPIDPPFFKIEVHRRPAPNPPATTDSTTRKDRPPRPPGSRSTPRFSRSKSTAALRRTRHPRPRRRPARTDRPPVPRLDDPRSTPRFSRSKSPAALRRTPPATTDSTTRRDRPPRPPPPPHVFQDRNPPHALRRTRQPRPSRRPARTGLPVPPTPARPPTIQEQRPASPCASQFRTTPQDHQVAVILRSARLDPTQPRGSQRSRAQPVPLASPPTMLRVASPAVSPHPAARLRRNRPIAPGNPRTLSTRPASSYSSDSTRALS